MHLLSSSALLLASGSILDEVVFSRPSWALAYLVVGCMGLAYVWGARQRRKAVAALGHAPMIARLLASVDPTKRAIKITCSLAATMLVATGLLRLQYGGVARKVQSSGLDIVLAVDYSKSMLAEDVFPNRSERLEAELGRFLEDAAQRQDRVGIVVFAGAARGLFRPAT